MGSYASWKHIIMYLQVVEQYRLHLLLLRFHTCTHTHIFLLDLCFYQLAASQQCEFNVNKLCCEDNSFYT